MSIKFHCDKNTSTDYIQRTAGAACTVLWHLDLLKNNIVFILIVHKKLTTTDWLNLVNILFIYHFHIYFEVLFIFTWIVYLQQFQILFHSTNVFLLRGFSGSHWPPVSPVPASASGFTEEPGWLSPPTPAVSHRSDSSETNQGCWPTAQLRRGRLGNVLEHFYLKGHLCHCKFLWMLRDGAIDGEAEWQSHKETLINYIWQSGRHPSC